MRAREVALGRCTDARRPAWVRTAALLILVAVPPLAAACGGSPAGVTVSGTVSTHPENDCRFASGGRVRPVLASVPVVFTDLDTGRGYATRIRPGTVRTATGACLQTGRYRIVVPRAAAYRVQVRYVPVFGGPPRPVRVTFEELRRRGFRLDLSAEHSTGE
jgi:hypothetical protein